MLTPEVMSEIKSTKKRESKASLKKSSYTPKLTFFEKILETPAQLFSYVWKQFVQNDVINELDTTNSTQHTSFSSFNNNSDDNISISILPLKDQ